MRDCFIEAKSLYSHYDRLCQGFQRELDGMPAGRLRHKRIRGHQRYYRKYKDGGDDRYSYLNKEAYARMLPVMERKKRLEAYLRQWRKWRPKLEGIFSQVDKLLADGGLFAAFAELVAAAPLSPELLAAAREDFKSTAPAGALAGQPSGTTPGAAESGLEASDRIVLKGQPNRYFQLSGTDPPYADQRRKRTAGGQLARSKSEVIVADHLRSGGLDYEYEPGLVLGDTVYHPDFMIRLPDSASPTGAVCVLWEHRGLYDDLYLKDWAAKIQVYRNHGIVEGKNLIVSHDGPEGHPDSRSIQARIDFSLLGGDERAAAARAPGARSPTGERGWAEARGPEGETPDKTAARAPDKTPARASAQPVKRRRGNAGQ